MDGNTVKKKKKSKDMMAIKVRIMAVSGVGELEGSCDGKQMQLKILWYWQCSSS